MVGPHANDSSCDNILHNSRARLTITIYFLSIREEVSMPRFFLMIPSLRHLVQTDSVIVPRVVPSMYARNRYRGVSHYHRGRVH